jgi:putative aldouronate transport system permease protein
MVSILCVVVIFRQILSTHWNAYFDAMMYLKSQNLYNIQLILRNAIANIEGMLNQTGNLAAQEQTLAFAEASKYAIIVASMLPVLIIYPFVQKYFIKGIMIGAIKG